MPRKIIKPSNFPDCVREYDFLIGISVGSCIDPNNHEPMMGDIYEEAHSHSYYDDPYKGWICLGYECLLHDKYALLHEVAHLIANKSILVPAHGKEWRRAVKAIGGTYKPYTWFHNGIDLSYPVDLSHADPIRR